MSAGTNRSIPTPVSVPNGGTGLAAGTSGGIPAYTGATTIASSGVLAASALVIGGGAGVAPSTTTTGAGVLVANINRPVFATNADGNALTVTRASAQEYTGYTSPVFLPVVTTLVAGWATKLINKSGGDLAVKSSDGQGDLNIASGMSAILICRSIAADLTMAAWDVIILPPIPLWLAAQNDYLTAANATDTDLTWPGTIGNMTGSLSGATFTAPTTGKYTFRTLLQYEGTGVNANNDEGLLTVKLTDSANTLIKTIRTGGVLEDASLPITSGTDTLEWTLSLTAGDTVKVRVIYTDGGDGNGLYFYGSTCQLKITQEL